MMRLTMIQMFFGFMAYGLSSAAAMVFLGGTLRVVTGWNLAIKSGSSSIALPDDMLSVVVLTVLFLVLAGICWSIANFDKVIAWVKAKPLLAAGAVVTSVLSIYGAYFIMVGGALGNAVEHNNPAAATKALESGKYPQDQLNRYLYQALKNGYLDVAKSLLDHGADANRIAGDHQSSLLADACIFFPKDSVLLLLERGAKTDLKDKFGRTAAQVMVLYRQDHQKADGQPGLILLLESLKKSGADLKAPATDGTTCLSVAKQYKYDQVIEFLEK
jgi:hypothetical protein